MQTSTINQVQVRDLGLVTVNDKLDMFDGEWWYVVTVAEIIRKTNYWSEDVDLRIVFDGYLSRHDKLISVYRECNRKIFKFRFHNKSKILNQNDTYHNISKSTTSCQFDQTAECLLCKRKCCMDCFALNIFISDTNKYQYHCKDCVLLIEHQYLFIIIKALSESIFDRDLIEINIISIISKYSSNYLGNENVDCCNEMDACFNKIKFDTKTTTKMMYQYHYDMTQNIDLQKYSNIRIFCNLCTRSKEKQLEWEHCRVFHDYKKMEICNYCQQKLCIHCLRGNQPSKCYGCSKIFCNECVQSIENNEFLNDLLYQGLCNECYILQCNACIQVICDKCSNGIESKPAKNKIVCDDCLEIMYIECIHSDRIYQFDGEVICGECNYKNKSKWYHCNRCKKKICSKCNKKYNVCCYGCSKIWCEECVEYADCYEVKNVLLCNVCYKISPFKCDKCRDIICYKCMDKDKRRSVTCDDCDDIIGIVCDHKQIAFKYGDNIVCNNCNKGWYDCNGCSLRLCVKCKQYHSDYHSVTELIQNKENIKMKRNYEYRRKSFRKHNKRNESKKKRKIKSFWKRKNEKKSNTKQLKRFNKRYALSLQF